MIRIKLKNLLQNRLNLVPYIIILIIFIMLIICTLGIGIPLYYYANNREINQVNLAKDGLNNFILDIQEGLSISTYQLSQDQDFIQRIANVNSKKEDAVGILRRKITEYVLYNNIDFMEIIDLKGKVIFNLANDPDREGLDLSGENFFNNLNLSDQIDSIEVMKNRLYFVSSIYLFKDAEKQAIITLGREIKYSVVKEWSKKLTTDIIPVFLDKSNNIENFPEMNLDSSSETYIYGISLNPSNRSFLINEFKQLDSKAKKIQIYNNQYAVSVLEVKNLYSDNVFKFYILRSLKEFNESIQLILFYVSLFLTPFLIIAVIFIVILGRSLLSLNNEVNLALEKLKVNYEKLKISEESLNLRINDALIVKALSDRLAQINDIQSLENEIVSNINVLITRFKTFVRYNINENLIIPTDIMKEKIIWKKEVYNNISNKFVGVYICYGNSEMTERERILMDTIFSTANLRYNNLCYIDEFVNRKITENEIMIAKKVHGAIMPEFYPVSPFFDISGYYEAATTLGGDFLSCYYDQNSKILRAYIGDVTGHGIPSAILSTAVMAQVEAFEDDIREKKIDYNFEDFFRRINSIVWRLGKQQFTMTFQILEIDFARNKIRVFNAAHNPMLLAQPNQEQLNRGKLFKPIMGAGMFLGYASQYSNKYHTTEFQLKSGMTFIMFTDGIVEALDEFGNMFSLKRMISTLSANYSLSSQEISKELLKDFKQFNHGKSLDDDITLLIVKVL